MTAAGLCIVAAMLALLIGVAIAALLWLLPRPRRFGAFNVSDR